MVSAEGEHISVKTVTTSSHVALIKGTLGDVGPSDDPAHRDRRGEVSIVEVYDGARDDLVSKCKDAGAKYEYAIKQPVAKRTLSQLKATDSAQFGDRTVRQLENGTIVVEIGGVVQRSRSPSSWEICAELGVGLLNGNGNKRNMRQLGRQRSSPPPRPDARTMPLVPRIAEP